MKKIGFFAGSSLCELGTASDVELFFDCIKEFVVPKFPDKNWDILLDRLYKRYIRLDELPVAATMLEDVRTVFSSLPGSVVDWSKISDDMSNLDINKLTLAEIFEKFFQEFSYCKESAEIFQDTWNIYQPVRIVVSDMPRFMTDKKRPIEDYDTLSGKPFWKD